MEQINSTYQLLELISKPVFCVKDGTIAYANQAAKSMQIQAGTAIEKLITDNYDAYTDFQNGCLFITLTMAGIAYGASVTKSTEYDFFTLEDPVSSDQLRTLSLAGQQLRIPLANLAASIDNLFAEKTSRVLRPHADKIHKGIHQLHRIINNMSDTAFLGIDTPTDETLDVGSIVDEVIKKSMAFLSDAGVTIQYTGLEHTVYTQANRNLLDRAFFNMLSNAVKFSDPHCPISVEVSQKGSKILFSVCNTSRSTRPETLANAFTRFERKPAIEDSRRGIGLGMPLIRAAAQAHGGTVLIDQPTPETVRVTMTLAIRQPEDPTLLRNPLTRCIDYAGGRDHALLELSEVLPSETYNYESD